MKVTRDDLKWAVTQSLLTSEQEERLWDALSSRNRDKPRFDAAHVAFYFGAMIVISAMGWFMTEAWDQMGPAGLLAISLIYAIVFAIGGNVLWKRDGLRIPGGLLYTLAVWMTPLAIFSIEKMIGIWPSDDPGGITDYHVWVRGGWIVMEIGTIIAGAITIRFRRFPFLTFPIAFSLWYMSMDLAPLVTGQDDLTFEGRAWVSILFGAAVIGVSYLVDLKGRNQDFAFWGYFFGLMAFWGGLVALDHDSELGWFVEFLVNLLLIVLALFLRRRVFLVFGALGAATYVGHLSWTIFQDSLLFPLVLTGAGLAIIALGVAYQKMRRRIEAWFEANVPESLRSLVPARPLER